MLNRPRRPHVLAAALLFACLPLRRARAGDTAIGELRGELEGMKAQMRQMQEKIQAQERLIEQLRAERGPSAVRSDQVPAATMPSAPRPEPGTAAARVSAPAVAEPRPVGERAVSASRAAAPPPLEVPVAQATAPAPWSPAQPISLLRGSRGYLNISFDALIDAGWSTDPDVPQLEPGDHDPNQRGFSLPNEELVLEGAIDPYFKGFADVVFKLDANNETDVELEEVYGLTTSLPWNLQGKAGQYFTEFGRVNQQHPHAWDFVDQALVIDRMFGPDGLRNPGARLSWLLPTPFYSEIYGSVQDSQGETAFSFRSGEEIFGRPAVDRGVRSLGDMLYVPRWVSSVDLTDAQTLMAGVSGAFGPNSSGGHTYTQIYGGDLYWKWKPEWQSGGFPFVAWQTELLGRNYQAGASETLPAQTIRDWGAYSQVLYGFTQRWVAGLRGDWVSGTCGSSGGPSQSCAERYRISPDLTFYPTEFSKIRLQYNFDRSQVIGSDSSVWMQLELLLGEHAAHKF